jgi:hypothetical protein
MSTIIILEIGSYLDQSIYNAACIAATEYGYVFDTLWVNPDDNIINTLNNLYASGYRKMIGFSRSKVFIQVIDWFENHDDCIGISCTSSLELNVRHKNLYRLTPSDKNVKSSYLEYTSNKRVLIIIEKDDPAAMSIFQMLKENLKDYKYILFEKINITTLNSIFPSYDIIIPLLVKHKNQYMQLLSKVLSRVPMHVDNIGETPPVLPNNVHEYIYIVYRPEASRIILDMQNKYGVSNVSPTTYDAIQLACWNMDKRITGAYGMIYFNENNDRMNYVYSHMKYDSITKTWFAYKQVGYEPGLGNYSLLVR